MLLRMANGVFAFPNSQFQHRLPVPLASQVDWTKIAGNCALLYVRIVNGLNWGNV